MPLYLKTGALSAPIPGTPILTPANPVVTSEGFSGAAGNIAAGRYTDIAPAGGTAVQWEGSSGGIALDGSGHFVRGAAGGTWTQYLNVGAVDVQAEYKVITMPTVASLRLLAKYNPTTPSNGYCQAVIAPAGVLTLVTSTSSNTTQYTGTYVEGDTIGIRVVGQVVSLLRNGVAIASHTSALSWSTHDRLGFQGSTAASFVGDNLVVRHITDVAAL